MKLEQAAQLAETVSSLIAAQPEIHHD